VPELPEPPACPYGYTKEQIERIVGSARLEEFNLWMTGQTMTLCEGRSYNHEKREYVENACANDPHGAVVYTHDLRRFVAGLPVID